ncbi:MAG: hypothetical protein IKZ88_06295 [Neisseriaceae bacterium]|nr:hypothetical protein [Neisseriaceae bacterium]
MIVFPFSFYHFVLSLYWIGYPNKLLTQFIWRLLRQGYAFPRNDDTGFRLPESVILTLFRLPEIVLSHCFTHFNRAIFAGGYGVLHYFIGFFVFKYG